MTPLQNRQECCHFFLLAMLAQHICKARQGVMLLGGGRLTRRSPLARCAVQGGGGRGAGGGGAGSGGGRGGGRTPGSAARGAGGGADGGGGLRARDAPLLLASLLLLLLLLRLQRLAADVMVLLPVLVLAEGAAVARCVAAAARLAGFAAAIPAALGDTRMKLTQTANSATPSMSEARREAILMES